jgi:hypothetical protein
MSTVRLNFQDFIDMVNNCEYGIHFEACKGMAEQLTLVLFIDGNPSSYSMVVKDAVVKTELEL